MDRNKPDDEKREEQGEGVLGTGEAESISAGLGTYPEQVPENVPEEDLAGDKWSTDIDEYPLRDKSDDPRWAMNIVKLWTGLALFFLLGLMVLISAGAILD